MKPRETLASLAIMAIILAFGANADTCTPMIDPCQHRELDPVYRASREADPELRVEKMREQLMAAYRNGGSRRLAAHADCLFRDPQAIDMHGVENILMLAEYPEQIIQYLDSNQLRLEEPSVQTHILRVAILEGKSKLWRGLTIKRAHALFLASTYGLTDLHPLVLEHCQTDSAPWARCERLRHLQSLFTSTGEFMTRAEAVATQILDHDPQSLSTWVHEDEEFENALEAAVGIICPKFEWGAFEHCRELRRAFCDAADVSYPPHPVAIPPPSRGPLDRLAGLVTPACMTPCP